MVILSNPPSKSEFLLQKPPTVGDQLLASQHEKPYTSAPRITHKNNYSKPPKPSNDIQQMKKHLCKKIHKNSGTIPRKEPEFDWFS